MAMIVATLGPVSVVGHATQRSRPAKPKHPPSRVQFIVHLDDPQPFIFAMYEANARDERENLSSPDDEDGYVWEVRDGADQVIARGRDAKTTTWRSEFDAQGRADPITGTQPKLSVAGIVPNVGGTLTVYDAVAHAVTGVRIAELTLSIIPAGALICFGSPTPGPVVCHRQKP